MTPPSAAGSVPVNVGPREVYAWRGRLSAHEPPLSGRSRPRWVSNFLGYIRGTFEVNTRMTRKIWDRLNGLDREEFRALIRGGDFLKSWKFIETNIFRL